MDKAFEDWWLTTGKHVGKNAAWLAWEECSLNMEEVVKNVIRFIDLCDKHSAEVRTLGLAESLQKAPNECKMCMSEKLLEIGLGKAG
jgi:hypothetical protein